MNISRLVRNDADACADINALLKQLVHDPSTFEPITAERFSSILAEPDTIVVAAEEEGRIVGTGSLFVVNKFRGTYGYIEDMIVDESQRGKGLGESIARKLIELGKETGVTTIELSTRPSRVAANSLYQKLGFEQKETNVYRLKL